MATLPSPPDEQTQKKKPNLPLLHLKSYSTDPDGNSPSCSTPRNNVSWADNRQDILQSDTLDDDKTSYYSLPTPCIFKLLQVVINITCTILYSDGLNAIQNNITTQLFTYIICSTYLIITPVILCSYVMGHRMPELIVRIFNALGGILFLVAGVVTVGGYSFYLEEYKTQLDNLKAETEGNENSIEKLNKQGAFLLVSGILCLLNSVLYFLDVGWSIYVTLSSL